MKLLPVLQTSDLTLKPTPFRPGVELHGDLCAEHQECVPPVDIFTELYCPLDTRSVAMQYEVLDAGSDRPVGWSTLIDLDTNARHVRAGVFVAPCAEARLGRSARLLTTNIAFAMWNVRKVYAWEIHGRWAWRPPAVMLEGTLREYLHDGSNHVDMDVTATYRSDWDAHGAALVEALVND